MRPARTEACAADNINLYARRFTIEKNFRDVKDLGFGMGLSSVQVGSAASRDRLLLVSALAIALLMLLGAAGESSGLGAAPEDQHGTAPVVLALQPGMLLYFQWMATVPEETFRAHVTRRAEAVREHAVFRETLGLI